MRIILPYAKHSDFRGTFTGIVNAGTWEEINLIETRAGQTRGGHYHAHTTELFLFLKGRVEVHLGQAGSQGHVVDAVPGTILVVEPMEVHTFHIREDSTWINVLSRRMDASNPDFHR